MSDRFFSREELDQCCATLFPGCQLERIGGAVMGLTWESALSGIGTTDDRVPDQVS